MRIPAARPGSRSALFALAGLLAALNCWADCWADSLPGASLPAELGRHARPGLTASVGLGGSYASYGAQLLYFQPLPTQLPWSLFASAAIGHLPALDERLTLTGDAPSVFGAAFAAGASFGRRHRLCADAGYGALASQALTIEGFIIDATARYGVFAELGYEFVGHKGLFVRVLPLGLGYLTSPLVEADSRLMWTGSAGIGWKFW